MTNGNRVGEIFDMLGGQAVLLPVVNGEKKPADKGWTSFTKAVMQDPAYLERLNNGGNIGVLLGINSDGLCSIDFDDDESVEEFLKHNPKLRLTLRTRRLKGCNFWLWLIGEYPGVKPFHHARLTDKGKPKPIGEWRSTGAQTVIDGEAGGIPYTRVITAKPIRIAFHEIVWPEWIADPPMLPLGPEISKSGHNLDLNKLDNVILHADGSVHAACPACREAGEDVSGNHLFIWPSGKYGCAKYVGDKEHRKLVWKLAGMPKIQNDAPWPEIDENGNPSESIILPAIIDAFDFIATAIPALPLLVDRLLHQGTKLALGGGSKAFKTWSLQDFAISIAFGIPWMGFDCIKGRVLYVNFEIHDRFFQDRLNVLLSARGVKLEKRHLEIWNLRGFAAPYQSIIPTIIQRIVNEQYAAVILDPIYKLYGKTDENSAGEVAQLLNCLETICVKTKAATAFGAHYSKGNQSSKESIDRISGSGVFARDPDSIIPFTKHEDENAFVVEPTLRNLPPVQPFVVRWRCPLMIPDDDADPSKLKKVGRTQKYDPAILLSFIVNNTKDNPISSTDWAKKADTKRSTLEGYFPFLRSKGWLITIGDGKNARRAITPDGISIVNKLSQST